jgi:hypothetical protein
MNILGRLRLAAGRGDKEGMDGQLELARRPQDSTSPGGIRDLERQFDDLPPVRGGIMPRLLGWVDPPEGTVGTGGAVARGLVCVLLCVVAALVVVGALTGLAVGIGSIV